MTSPYEAHELIRQMDEIGTKSLPLVALAGGAIGVVLSLLTRDIENICRYAAHYGVDLDGQRIAERLWRRFKNSEL